MPRLEDEPQSGRDLEDYTAALFQSAGYYVEKNIKEEDPHTVLELDVVATDYATDAASPVIVEAKSGDWGFTDLFKIAGQMQYLGIERGGFFVSREVRDRPAELVASRASRLGITFVLLNFSDATASFTNAGFGPIAEPDEVHLWRWGHVLERKLTNLPKQWLHSDADSEGARAIRQYHRLVNNGIFFLEDVRERIVALYDAYQSHPRLSAGCARELAGYDFDPQTTQSGGVILTEAMREGGHPLIQASFYVEQRARLAILKAAIDLLAQDPSLPQELQRRAPGGFRYLVLPQLPGSFRDGIEWLCQQPSYRRYALLWQLFLWGCGGFYLHDRLDEEFDWLSARSGVPRDEIPTALGAFDRFFPADGWVTRQGWSECVILKMMPVAFRGLGAHLRRGLYGWAEFSDGGYADYTSADLTRWNTVAVNFVSDSS